MTNHVARLYAAAGSLLAFFLAWAGIATHPWSAPGTPSADRARAVSLYEQRLRRDAAILRRLSSESTTRPVPPVRIVTLPPLTTTRSS